MSHPSDGERFRALVDHSLDVIALIEPDGKVIYASPSILQVLGYTPEEFLQLEPFEIVHPDDRDLAMRRLATVVQEPQGSQTVRNRVRHKDGSWRWVETVSTNQLDNTSVRAVVANLRDISDRRRIEETLREREEHLAAIVDSSDDIIVSKTLDGVIASWNRGAERILGYRADEVVGRHVSMLMPPGNIEDTERILGRIRQGMKVDHYETKRLRKDGRVIDVSLTVSPIRDVNGVVIGASKIGRDITQQKFLETERREADRRKDEFLAMLAHELRNPLASIDSAVQLLGKLGMEEDLQSAKDVAQRHVRRLARLIDDLLDVSRITRGKISLRKEPADLSPIVSSAVEAVRPLLEERKHEINVSLAGTLRLEADPLRVEQILVNLLTNAANYTEPGGRIGLSVRQEGDEIVIKVRDTGVGIDPQLLPHIFDLFAQGNRTIARAEGGLGIGLTLVKSLVAMHGGSVTATSEGTGQGSEFTVRLPALPGRENVTEKPMEGLPRVARSRSRVIVVDDNADAAHGIAKLLELLGYDVQVAYDGPSAIELARSHKPEVVLLDIGLPGMDGYQVARQLRLEDDCKHALIIAISGYGQEEDRRRTREAGFDHHLVKPVDYDALMSLLAEHVQGTQRPRSPIEPGPPRSGPPEGR